MRCLAAGRNLRVSSAARPAVNREGEADEVQKMDELDEHFQSYNQAVLSELKAHCNFGQRSLKNSRYCIKTTLKLSEVIMRSSQIRSLSLSVMLQNFQYDLSDDVNQVIWFSDRGKISSKLHPFLLPLPRHSLTILFSNRPILNQTCRERLL